jgi:hypothetical protein
MLTHIVKGCARHGVRERAGARREVREGCLRPAGAKPLARARACASSEPCATTRAPHRRLSDDPKSARLNDKTWHAEKNARIARPVNSGKAEICFAYTVARATVCTTS